MTFLAMIVILALLDALLWMGVRGACGRPEPKPDERKTKG
jgi:hypothetical protein